MEKEYKAKYDRFKLTVKRWEDEFKKTNHRIPSKVSEKNFYLFFFTIFTQILLIELVLDVYSTILKMLLSQLDKLTKCIIE